MIRGAIAAFAVALVVLLAPAVASATPPATPVITEPGSDGQLVHPADVHMEATGFSDADGDTHACSDWQILDAGSLAPVWRADCATGTDAVHIHLGDGQFVGAYAGQTELEYSHQYVLRVRFQDSAAEDSDWAQRPFGTYPPSSPGGAVPWTPVQPGYKINTIANDLQLPVDIAFVPNPGHDPSDPLLYVTELYGAIKVINRDGSEGDYATGLLNFNPTGNFPGSGEQGLTGITVDPATGDVFAAMVYDGDGSDATTDDRYPEVVRFHSTDGGHTAATETPVFQMPGEPEGPSHQISNLTIGPDGKLWVHNGDGFDPSTALDLSSFRGKILRMNLDGSAPADNPYYDATDGTDDPQDYIYAYGFRNPFGGAWRAANGKHYEVEDGPNVDRFARIDPATSYHWKGLDGDMLWNSLYNWAPAHAPVNIAFVQHQTFLGSGFPAPQMDHAFVTESGPTYATGPQEKGKRIVEFDPQPGGEMGGHPHGLVEYTGTGKATAVGLAAGPDGLYWTDLYKDQNYSSPIDAGARLLRVRYVGTSPDCTLNLRTLVAEVKGGGRATIKRGANGSIRVNGHDCGATVLDIDAIRVKGAGGNETAILDLAHGALAPGYSSKPDGAPAIPLSVGLGAGHRDALGLIEGAGDDTVELRDHAVVVNGVSQISTTGVESVQVHGGAGDDTLRGGGGPHVLNGGRGDDDITGSGGDDEITGGRGSDTVSGDSGNDTIDVRGGGRDRVNCGPGHDMVTADSHDHVAANCEFVTH